MDDLAPLLEIGASTHDLLANTDWVARRVETVRYLDASRLERRITLDVDRKQLESIAAVSEPALLLPLVVLEKGLLLDLDVTADGVAVPVATSRRDSEAAAGAAMHSLIDEGVDPLTLPPAFWKTTMHATRCMPSVADLAILRRGAPTSGSVDAWQLLPDVTKNDGDNAEDAKAWKKLLEEHDSFWVHLRNFTSSFMLMIDINLDDPPAIIKLRYVETQVPAQMTWGERLGLDPFNTLVEAQGVSTAGREHLRLEAPPGVIVEQAWLWAVDDRPPPGLKPQPSSGHDTYQRRITLERAAFYTSNLPDSSYSVALSLRADPSGFLRRSQYVIALALAMLLSGSLAESFQNVLSSLRQNNTDPTVAMMLLVPTLLVAYVAREGDHQVLSDLLRTPRALVASTGVATLAAAVGLVVGLPSAGLQFVWCSMAAWCSAVLIWLLIVNARSRATIATVREDHGRTEQETLTVLQF